jgi:hypothetical protein
VKMDFLNRHTVYLMVILQVRSMVVTVWEPCLSSSLRYNKNALLHW